MSRRLKVSYDYAVAKFAPKPTTGSSQALSFYYHFAFATRRLLQRGRRQTYRPAHWPSSRRVSARRSFPPSEQRSRYGIIASNFINQFACRFTAARWRSLKFFGRISSMRRKPCLRSSTLTPHHTFSCSAAESSFPLRRLRSLSARLVST